MFKNKIIDYYFNKSIEYGSNYQNYHAIRYVDKILSIDDNNCEALSFKGLYYSCLFDKINAFDCFNKIHQINPNYIYGYYREGLACIQLEEYNKAINSFKKILVCDSNHVDTLNHIGESYLDLKEYDESLKYLHKALDIEANAFSFVQLSLYYVDFENFDEAIICLKKALRLDENCFSAWLELSNIYFHLKNYKKSLNYLELILKKVPDNKVAIISKLRVLAYLNRFDESKKGFQKFSNLNFDDYQLIGLYYSYYGESLKEMKKYDDALKLYDEYLENYPNYPKEDILAERNKLIELK